MIKHFVMFEFPGMIVGESMTVPVPDKNSGRALSEAKKKPGCYAFYFTTRELRPGDWDHQEIYRSPRFFVGGTVRLAAEILAGTDPREEIMRWNVESNKYAGVVRTPGGNHFELREGDVVL